MRRPRQGRASGSWGEEKDSCLLVLHASRQSERVILARGKGVVGKGEEM